MVISCFEATAEIHIQQLGTAKGWHQFHFNQKKKSVDAVLSQIATSQVFVVSTIIEMFFQITPHIGHADVHHKNKSKNNNLIRKAGAPLALWVGIMLLLAMSQHSAGLGGLVSGHFA